MADQPYDIRMDEAATLLPPDICTAYLACHSVVDQRLLALPYNLIRTEREPGSCTAAFVPFLGWERSVHHWSPDEATARARAATSFADHAGYGSPPALAEEIALDVDYPGIAVRDWWEVPGFSWPDFLVVVPVVSAGPTPPSYADVRASATRRKNVRDWPGEVRFEAREDAPLGIAAVPVLNGTIHLLPLDPTPQQAAGLFFGAAASLTGTIILRPF